MWSQYLTLKCILELLSFPLKGREGGLRRSLRGGGEEERAEVEGSEATPHLEFTCRIGTRENGGQLTKMMPKQNDRQQKPHCAFPRTEETRTCQSAALCIR